MKSIFLSTFFFVVIFNTCGQTFNGTGGPIPDDGNTYEFNLQVSGLNPATLSPAYGLMSVCLDITHTWDDDLDISLRSPDGHQQILISRCGGSGDNFTGTCLTTSATTLISQGSAPFTGNFMPFEWMGNFNNGMNGNGTWKLVIRDTYPWADAGTLNAWSISFGPSVSGPFPFFKSNLPIVIINTGGAQIQDEPKIPANMKIIDNGQGMMNYLSDTSYAFDGRIGIEIRGNFSAGFPQKPYGFETWDVNGNDSAVSLMGMPAESDWILQTTHTDKSFMRNVIAFDLFRYLGHYAPRTRYCEVMLNGVYKGVYIFCEKIKRDSQRVNVSRLDTTDVNWPDISGGYIFKNDYWNSSDSWLSAYHPLNHPGKDVHFVYYYPKSDEILPVQKNYLQAYVDSFETALYSSNFADPFTGYRKYCETTSFIDYLMVNELARNNDGFKKSVYYHKNKLGRLCMGPVWDFDWAWKNINECSIFAATDGSGWAYNVNDCNPDVNGTGWWVRMMQDSSMANDVKCRWLYLRNYKLDTTVFFAYIDSIAYALDSAQQRHYLAWPIHGIWWGVPEIDPPTNSFQEEVSRLKHWIALRIAWIDDHLPGNCFTSTAADASAAEDNEWLYGPNPATDVLYISHPGGIQIQRVSVYDMNGRLVSEILNPDEELVTVKLNDINPGLYAVCVTHKSGKKVFRIVKQ
jgi:subtilisin-like proprotein convertase family protein